MKEYPDYCYVFIEVLEFSVNCEDVSDDVVSFFFTEFDRVLVMFMELV